MKRLNYYQVHRNKQPKKLKFQTIKKKHVSFSFSIDTREIEKAFRGMQKSCENLSKALKTLSKK